MLARPARGHCPTNHPLVGDIEERTKRFITIEHRKTAASLAKCHSQEQSPLFSLPAEIRDVIFSYVSQPNINPAHLRNGPECLVLLRMPVVWRVNLSWLRSCRRIWLEANQLAWKHAEPTFYRHSDRPDLWGFLYQLTSLNVESLQHLHLGQECHSLRVNDCILRLFNGVKMQVFPRHMTITLVAYPWISDLETVKIWFTEIITHRKLQTVQQADFIFHIPESQAESILQILQGLPTDPGSSEWLVTLPGGEGKHWLREWGDAKLERHWANRVDMPYRTLKLSCERVAGTCKEGSKTYEPKMEWDCWHLIPYRVMFRRRDSIEPVYGCADRLAEQRTKRWEEENSLLRFDE